MDLDHLKVSIKEVLSEKRYAHTIRVMNTGIMLAKHYDVCQVSTQIAALLHDIAKNLVEDKLRERLECSKENEYLNFSPLIWHAPVGAIIAKEDYQMIDDDILNAIKYHTTGRCGMSKLEKIIFIADYIEPNRTQPNVDTIRKLATQSLEAALAKILEDTIDYLNSKAIGVIHPDMLAAYQYYHEYL